VVFSEVFYEKGWVALCDGVVCNAKHVMVNNWANGWIFENPVNINKVKVVFWPQILEYIGFIMVGLTFVTYHYSTNKNNKSS
jgi:hypothetical protein